MSRRSASRSVMRELSAAAVAAEAEAAVTASVARPPPLLQQTRWRPSSQTSTIATRHIHKLPCCQDVSVLIVATAGGRRRWAIVAILVVEWRCYAVCAVLDWPWYVLHM